MDYEEEQSMEIEALQSIYMEDFTSVSESPHEFIVNLVPSPGADEENHVGVKLTITLPAQYPEEAPEVLVDVVKGLSSTQHSAVKDIVATQIEENMGMPFLYMLCEAVKEYLAENNKPKGDGSVHEEIMKKMAAKQREEDEEKKQEQRKKDAAVMYQRKKDGVPVTPETFAEWQAKFLEEMRSSAPKKVYEGPSGREYFENGNSLSRSDAAIIAGAEAEAAAMEDGGGGGSGVAGAIDKSVFHEEEGSDLSDLSDLEDSDEEDDE